MRKGVLFSSFHAQTCMLPHRSMHGMHGYKVESSVVYTSSTFMHVCTLCMLRTLCAAHMHVPSPPSPPGWVRPSPTPFTLSIIMHGWHACRARLEACMAVDSCMLVRVEI